MATREFQSATASIQAAQYHKPDNQQILQTVWQALERDDFETVGLHVTPDVEFAVYGFPRMDGRWRGYDAVMQALRRNFLSIEQQSPQVECVLQEDRCICVLMRETGQFVADKQPYSLRATVWYWFRDGKIERVEEFCAIDMPLEEDEH